MIRINGENIKGDKIRLCDFLKNNNYSLKNIAIEINGEIIPKSDYIKTVLYSGDIVEIVSLVGGG